MGKPSPLISSLTNLHDSEDDAHPGLFECRFCSTHVALNKNMAYSITPFDSTGISFTDLVNVKISPRIYVANHIRVVADIHCKGCNNHIGWKLAENQPGAGDLVLQRENILW